MSIQSSRCFLLATYFNLLFLIPAGFMPIKVHSKQQLGNQDKELQQEAEVNAPATAYALASMSEYFYDSEYSDGYDDYEDYEDYNDYDDDDDYGYPEDSKDSGGTVAVETTENRDIETTTCSAVESTIDHTTAIQDLGSAVTCLIATELDGVIQTAIGRAAMSNAGLSADNDVLVTSSTCNSTSSRGNVFGAAIDPAITFAVELAIQTAVGNATATIGSAVNYALELAVERNISSTINCVVDCAVKDAFDAAIDRSIDSLNDAVKTATEIAIVPAVEQTVDRALGPAIDSAIASRSKDSMDRAITPAVMNIVDSAVGAAIECALVAQLDPPQIAADHATIIKPAIDRAVDSCLEDSVDKTIIPAVANAVDFSVDAAIKDALAIQLDATQIVVDHSTIIEPAVSCAVNNAFNAAIDRSIGSVKPAIDRTITSYLQDSIDTTITPAVMNIVDSGIDAVIDCALMDATQIAIDRATIIEPAVGCAVSNAFNAAIDRSIGSVGPAIARAIASCVEDLIDETKITPAVMNIVDSGVDAAIKSALITQLDATRIAVDHATILEPDIDCAVGSVLNRVIKPAINQALVPIIDSLVEMSDLLEYFSASSCSSKTIAGVNDDYFTKEIHVH